MGRMKITVFETDCISAKYHSIIFIKRNAKIQKKELYKKQKKLKQKR